MRLKTSTSKNSVSYYVQKDVKKGNTRSTIVVEKLGTEKQIMEKYGVSDAKEWALNYVAELNKKEASEKADLMPISISYDPSKIIEFDEENSRNVGYLFLRNILNELKLDKISKNISNRYNFKFDLNKILNDLVCSRILFPGSKRSTLEESDKFLEKPNYLLVDMYRALGVLKKENDFIQAELYKNSSNVVKRDTRVLYYDCTNYFFEIEEPDVSGLRKYGKSKEHRPNPIVQMGLFLDGSGIPLAFNITPGNTNEQTTLIPLEEKIIKDFDLSKFVCCTDAGLNSKQNRKFNHIQERAYISTYSLKKAKDYIQLWAFDDKDWKIDEGSKAYSLKEINDPDNYSKFRNTIFYKKHKISEIRNKKSSEKIESGLEDEHLIVTYSLKYSEYQKNIRKKQLERAVEAINSDGTKLGTRNQNDYRRFIGKTNVTDDGEPANKEIFFIDDEKIEEEAKYDGFYAVVTNLDDDPKEIARINKERWRIEECFRIMKTEFKSRPVYLRRDDRIIGHFLTCYMALLVFKILEKKLDSEFTVEEIISTLKNMNLTKTSYNCYLPSFTRTKLTDKLHQMAGFRLDYQIITEKNMKKALKSF